MSYRSDIVTCLERDGFAFTHSLMPEASTISVAEQLGSPVHFEGREATEILMPRSTEEAPMNTYGGNYGFGEYPLHTDLAIWYRPPRYFMLRCLVGSEVSTTIVNPDAAIRQIGPAKLARVLMKPRKRVKGRMDLLPLTARFGAISMLRWDERFVEPASPASAQCASDFHRLITDAQKEHVVLADLGDTLIVDNWRVLHGRTPVPEVFRSRRIERVYLEALR